MAFDDLSAPNVKNLPCKPLVRSVSAFAMLMAVDYERCPPSPARNDFFTLPPLSPIQPHVILERASIFDSLRFCIAGMLSTPIQRGFQQEA